MNQLSGHTTAFAVLGHPIGHTLSPVMHNASFQSLGTDAIYLAFDVHPNKLMDVLPVMADMGFGGVNLTVPLKEVAYHNINKLDNTAKKLGAVNTVHFLPKGELMGANTDGAGFLLALNEAFQISVKEKRVFILGTGGAGRALAITCAEAGAERLLLTDLDEKRSKELTTEIQTLFPGTEVQAVPCQVSQWTQASLQSQLIIQATPVGMNPQDKPLLTGEAFREGQYLYDLVYMYPQTGIMKEALSAGARSSNGLGMLLHQGARSYEIWTGQKADVKAMRRALERSVYGALS